MIKYCLYKGVQLRTGAALALYYHLYVDGWLLRDNLQDFVNGLFINGSQIVLAINDSVPVAVAIFHGSDNRVMAFTKKQYRRHGIGRRCISTFENLPANCNACEGIDGTLDFWRSSCINVEARNYKHWPKGIDFE